MRRFGYVVAPVLLAVALAAGTLDALAQEPGQATRLEVTVEEVDGSVEYRPRADTEWSDATVGLKLAEGAQVSTGLASKVGLAFADNSVVVLGSLTEVTIDKFLKDAEAVRTRLRMKTGTLRAKVRSEDVRSDFRVATPNMTSSVKGTKIQEITTSPDMGDYVALGDEGLLLAETEWGRRFIDPKTATTSQLIRLVEQAKLARTFKYTPLLGLTDEEEKGAFNKPDQLDISPAQGLGSASGLLGDRTGSQEGGPSGESGQIDRIIGGGGSE